MIQDLINSSRRMASLYRFRFIQPAHLLYALTGNDTGRDLLSREGFNVYQIRVTLIREFKLYSSKIKDPNGGVEPSDIFTQCCESYLVGEDSGSYEDGLLEVLRRVESFQEEDRIVSLALTESDMKRKVENPQPVESEDIFGMDDIFNENEGDFIGGTSLNQAIPAEAFKKSVDPGDEEIDGTMRSAFEARMDQTSSTRKRPSDKATKEMAEALAAVQAAQRNLTDLAHKGSLDPVVGRDAEISHVVEVLMRRRKPNVILVAEPGVGKSALVEGLAMHLVSEEASGTGLTMRPVKEVSLTNMVAGSRYRGDFESRMSIMIEEAEKEKAILFIDEIHTIMGSGSVVKGGLDGANILKPALARDGLSVIGATTPEEAVALREDRALMRRFELIYLCEPQRAQMEVILKGAAEKFLSKHKVRMCALMQSRLLDFGERYLKHRRNPDRTFDLLDLAAVSVRRRNARRMIEIDVRHAVLRLGGDLPVENTMKGHGEKSDLIDGILANVKGNDQTIKDIVDVMEASGGISGLQRVMYLGGPEGVGKTHFVESLASQYGKRMQSIRFYAHRPDGTDNVWARIIMALEADSNSIIAIQHADKSLMDELNARIASETQGGGRLAAALRSPMIFCLGGAIEAEAKFGFNAGVSDDVSSSDVFEFKHASGDQLEELVVRVVNDIRQIQDDAGLKVSSEKKIRAAMKDAISSPTPTYRSLQKAGIQSLKG